MFSYNHDVVRILEVDSKKPLLQKEALAVFTIAAQDLIHIDPEWIPRTENQQAGLSEPHPGQGQLDDPASTLCHY